MTGAKEEGIGDEEIRQRLTDESDSKFAQKAANAGLDMFKRMEKAMVLQSLDQHWKEHLLNLDPSASGHQPARLRPARPAERIQDRGLPAF